MLEEVAQAWHPRYNSATGLHAPAAWAPMLRQDGLFRLTQYLAQPGTPLVLHRSELSQLVGCQDGVRARLNGEFEQGEGEEWHSSARSELPACVANSPCARPALRVLHRQAASPAQDFSPPHPQSLCPRSLPAAADRAQFDDDVAALAEWRFGTAPVVLNREARLYVLEKAVPRGLQ